MADSNLGLQSLLMGTTVLNVANRVGTGGAGGQETGASLFPSSSADPASGVSAGMVRGRCRSCLRCCSTSARVIAWLESAALWVLFNIPSPMSPAFWPICPAVGEACRLRDVILPGLAVLL